MESKYKTDYGGAQVLDTRSSRVTLASPRSFRSSDFLLRLLAVATTLVAAIVMGLAKETETVPIVLIPGGDPVRVSVSAKIRYSSAFVYFEVVNVLACVYTVLSLLVTIKSGVGPKGLALGIAIIDVLMVGLLFSGIGAATSFGLIGYNGNSHVGWKKVCNVFEKFCHNVMASVIVSLIGSLAFILIVALSALNLH